MKRRLLIWVILAVYLAVLLRLTVFRNGCFSHALCSGRVVWGPFIYLIGLLQQGNLRYFLYLFVGNLVWFVPLGFLLRLLGLSWKQTLLCGLGLSVLIEATQFVLGCGVSETEDVILNTCGTGIGCGLYVLFRRLHTSRRQHRQSPCP